MSGSEKRIFISINEKDLPEFEKTIKDTRIQFRIEKSEKARWIDFIEENNKFKDLTELILTSVQKTIKQNEAKHDLKHHKDSLTEDLFASFIGGKDYYKSISKQAEHQVFKMKKHLNKLNELFPKEDIAIDRDELIEVIQRKSIETAMLCSFLYKK